MNKQMFWYRFGAWFFDYAILFAFTFWFAYTFGEPNDKGGYTVDGFVGFVPIAFWFFWLVFPEGMWGATLGKKIMGLKVIQSNGRSLGIAKAFGRRMCDIFDFSMSFGIVAIICYFKSSLGQRLGDRAVNAVVILADEHVAPLDAIAANKAEK